LSAGDAIAISLAPGYGPAASIAGENSFAKRAPGDFNGATGGSGRTAMNETDDFTGTMPVTERNRFDTAGLTRWMRAQVDDFRGDLDI
jgi:hypothetical protein